MKDLPAWDAVWTRVNGFLQDVVLEVKRVQPGAWSSVTQWRSDAFPFSAHLSFGTGNPATADEAVVVSITGFVDGETLKMSSDLSRGDGYIFADGPGVVVGVSEAKQDLGKLLESWLVGLEAFVRSETIHHVMRELGTGH